MPIYLKSGTGQILLTSGGKVAGGSSCCCSVGTCSLFDGDNTTTTFDLNISGTTDNPLLCSSGNCSSFVDGLFTLTNVALNPCGWTYSDTNCSNCCTRQASLTITFDGTDYIATLLIGVKAGSTVSATFTANLGTTKPNAAAIIAATYTFQSEGSIGCSFASATVTIS